MSTPDETDVAGWAYLLTEYDDLLSTLDESRFTSRSRVRVKRDETAAHWAAVRGLAPGPVAELVADAQQYRDAHSQDVAQYLVRFNSTLKAGGS